MIGDEYGNEDAKWLNTDDIFNSTESPNSNETTEKSLLFLLFEYKVLLLVEFVVRVVFIMLLNRLKISTSKT